MEKVFKILINYLYKLKINYMLKKNLLFILSAVLLIPLLGLGCNDLPKDQQADYEKDVKPLIEETETAKKKVRGSCDLIAKSSHCMDFVGSIFTEERMKLSCAEGKFSKNTCPYSKNGGCRATGDTVSESVVWSYDYGGNPIDAEAVKYEAMACDSLVLAEWISAEQFDNIK